MKTAVLAVAAAIAVGVNGTNHAGRRHAHQAFHERNVLLSTGAPETCGCTTIYTTITGAPTLYFPPAPTSTTPPPPPPTSSTSTSTVSLTTAKPSPTSSPAPVVPTPFATTCPTTGVYTIPATTITLTSETTVCGAESTTVPAGTHTAGGVTTVVETETTVVCPYATTTESEGVVTSTILTTTYVCPSAGTYVIAPLTTTVSESTVWVYPTPASYPAGTYTQAEVVTTITETDYVIVCPFTSPAPAPTYAPAPVVSSSPKPVVTYSAVPIASPTKTPTGGSLPNGHLGNSGDQWGLTYTPYDEQGACKSADAVRADLIKIKAKGFTIVRVYSTDCSALENIGNAAADKDIQLKLILGVFISTDKGGIPGAQPQVTELTEWAHWDLVELIVVGNEAVGQGACTASELAAFIGSCKTAFKASGYKGLVTTTETLNIWQSNPGVFCDVVDVTGVNLHAFFNPDTEAADAGKLIKAQLEIADELCEGKYAVNLETGWPTYAKNDNGQPCNGKACASVENQAAAIASIKAEAGGISILFSYHDDDWKNPGFLECERSWGLKDFFN